MYSHKKRTTAAKFHKNIKYSNVITATYTRKMVLFRQRGRKVIDSFLHVLHGLYTHELSHISVAMLYY